MARRYLCRPLPDPGPAELPDDVAHHVRTVMRLRVGDPLRLFDGDGREATATVTRTERRAVHVEVAPVEEVRREPARRVEIAFAIPKGSRADWLLEHGTEIGIAAFRPVIFARSNRSATPRLDRWEKIIHAACGQCDRSQIPALHAPASVAQILSEKDLPAHRVVAALGDHPAIARAPEAGALLLVGPEGGIQADELETIDAAGFQPGSLGPLTLRTETAALVGATRLLTE